MWRKCSQLLRLGHCSLNFRIERPYCEKGQMRHNELKWKLLGFTLHKMTLFFVLFNYKKKIVVHNLTFSVGLREGM